MLKKTPGAAENTKEVLLKSNKSGNWVNTGQKFE
jgi:hypothetical protein